MRTASKPTKHDSTVVASAAVAVDVALLAVCDQALHTLVLERTDPPARGKWALPSGFVGPKESLEAAAARVLAEEAGLEGVFLEQLFTFGDPRRDPRGRVISVAYYALVDAERLAAASRSERGAARVCAIDVPWSGETGGPVGIDDGMALVPMAFDHADILGMAVKRIRGKLDYTPIGFQLLPETFTLADLQAVHEAALGHALNKDSFRRKMLASGQLEATGTRQDDVKHRPPELYRFRGRAAV